MDRLKDKVALVFGAGSAGDGWGNGKAAAAAYAREGAKVVCVDVSAQAAEATCRVVEEEGGIAIARTADVTRADRIDAVVADSLEAFGGRIDILHNNVGINVPGGAAEATEESWRKVMDINATGVFLTCKAVLPVMERQRAGAIVNVSSLAAIRWTGYPYISYYASKAAVNTYTRAVAVEFADRGIRANTVMPGVMDTPHVRQQIQGYHGSADEMKAKRDAVSPMKRQGTAWDVAWASVFLASDEAQYITGVELPIDGGLHCL